MELYLFFAAALLLPLAASWPCSAWAAAIPACALPGGCCWPSPRYFPFWPPRPTGAPASPPAFWPCFI